ncbi:MAG: hypothetical protein ACE5GD_08245 [Candidatus Geothermarchaeales archaeon]
MKTEEDRMVRTSITIPRSLKERMDEVDVNWSSEIREIIKRRLEQEVENDTVEAVLLNERLRRRAPEGWDSAEAIRLWRSRR